MPIVFLYAALTLSTVTFPLRISVGVDAQGEPVATTAWMAAQLAQAQELFAPFGVAFARTEGAPFDGQHGSLARVETRADRDAFASRTQAHAIDVFVVESLRDVDDPSQMRRGVHWHAGPVHYILLVGTAPPAVLAHELGHYFGNAHSPVPDNVMSYHRAGGPVFFDAAQGKRIAARAREYVQSGELLPVTPAAPPATP